MSAPILYLGDTSLSSAAAYLAGVMHQAGLRFDYVPSHVDLSLAEIGASRRLFIVSDYPAARMSDACQQAIVSAVAAGAGLLMIGGWESYQGSGGGWHGTALSEVLPVEIAETDDRRNCDHLVLVRRTGAEHAITAELPWDERPPIVGGFNQTRPRPQATVLLEAEHFRPTRQADNVEFTRLGTDPLLVIREHARGRVAALLTDVAPHWVGPLVDWGQSRVSAQAPSAEAVEVGDLYAKFLTQLVNWCVRAT